jgi:hypothetical protein
VLNEDEVEVEVEVGGWRLGMETQPRKVAGCPELTVVKQSGEGRVKFRTEGTRLR